MKKNKKVLQTIEYKQYSVVLLEENPRESSENEIIVTNFYGVRYKILARTGVILAKEEVTKEDGDRHQNGSWYQTNGYIENVDLNNI